MMSSLGRSGPAGKETLSTREDQPYAFACIGSSKLRDTYLLVLSVIGTTDSCAAPSNIRQQSVNAETTFSIAVCSYAELELSGSDPVPQQIETGQAVDALCMYPAFYLVIHVYEKNRDFESDTALGKWYP